MESCMRNHFSFMSGLGDGQTFELDFGDDHSGFLAKIESIREAGHQIVKMGFTRVQARGYFIDYVTS